VTLLFLDERTAEEALFEQYYSSAAICSRSLDPVCPGRAQSVGVASKRLALVSASAILYFAVLWYVVKGLLDTLRVSCGLDQSFDDVIVSRHSGPYS